MAQGVNTGAFRRAERAGEIDVGVQQLTQPESLGQAGGKDQTSIGDGMIVVEGEVI